MPQQLVFWNEIVICVSSDLLQISSPILYNLCINGSFPHVFLSSVFDWPFFQECQGDIWCSSVKFCSPRVFIVLFITPFFSFFCHQCFYLGDEFRCFYKIVPVKRWLPSSVWIEVDISCFRKRKKKKSSGDLTGKPYSTPQSLHLSRRASCREREASFGECTSRMSLLNSGHLIARSGYCDWKFAVIWTEGLKPVQRFALFNRHRAESSRIINSCSAGPHFHITMRWYTPTQ